MAMSYPSKISGFIQSAQITTRNFNLLVLSFSSAYVATAFPYDDLLSWIVVFALMLFTSIKTTRAIEATLGCFQSMLAISLAIVGIVLLRVQISPEWVISLTAISMTAVSSNLILLGRPRHHDFLAFSFDNKVYYSLMTFGFFMILQNFEVFD